jgi:N-acetylneuraminate synthase/N,N'-diacetyllegionaminate synthase
MVVAIRNIEQAISGSGIKEPSVSEMKNLAVARKSLHTVKELKAGTILSEDDLIALRPGNGISPMLVNDVVGKVLKKELPAHYLLKPEDLV